jgi:hypothetical protein
MVRLIAGGLAQTVRASVGAWDRARPAPAAYAAHVTFAGGAFASLTYNGYGHFDSDEFMGWIGEGGEPKDQARSGHARARLAGLASAEQEASLKAAGSYGGADYGGPSAASRATPKHQHFGLLIASCDRATCGRLRTASLSTTTMAFGWSRLRLRRFRDQKSSTSSTPR